MRAVYLCVCAALACFGQVLQAEQSATVSPDKSVVWRLIPKTADAPLGAQERQDIQKVVEFGPAVLPVLSELLREQAAETTPFSRLMISRLITIARQVEGDHEPVIAALRQLLQHQNVDVRRHAVAGIGEMGKTGDADFLLPLLTDTSEVVRVNAALALGRIGDEAVGQRMGAILQQRRSNMGSEDVRRDSSFAHGYQAVSNIVSRHAVPKQ